MPKDMPSPWWDRHRQTVTRATEIALASLKGRSLVDFRLDLQLDGIRIPEALSALTNTIVGPLRLTRRSCRTATKARTPVGATRGEANYRERTIFIELLEKNGWATSRKTPRLDPRRKAPPAQPEPRPREDRGE